MKKKLVLAAAGVFSVFALAACSSSDKNEDIATMKGSTITVQDFYDQIKHEQSSQQQVMQMIVYKVFDDKYGKKVSDKDVDKQYDETAKAAEAQGTTIEDYLKQNGQTVKEYKKTIKQGLAYQKGIEDHIKISNKDLKTAWKSFHPEVEAQIIQIPAKKDAKDIKKQLTDGGDFTKIAKEKSTDNQTKKDGGKIKFDSQTQSIPQEVKDAAFKLKDGEVSEPIQTTNSSTYQSSYYLVKMNKNKAKGNDMKPYNKELKKIAKQTKMNDQAFTTKVIGDELKDANVKIKDDAFKNVLANFTKTNDSSNKSSNNQSKDIKDNAKTKNSNK
ncbi:peptidylprolyl isomerase [Melissococcus plutonius]|uniref:peptidylprolyl isomerase n=1 Tax=Melissococcus plutonius TaxID=33970 RepID=UPI0021E59BA0|nr:peptidylprolyl isomerase [Melissococcus plutonius]MCV2504447.1 peptidylprolyl isomerase [Melissococcus plutonius]